MSEIQRICVQCGQANSVEARFCAACGYDQLADERQNHLPAQRTNLPAVISRAALPVLLGAASLAMRAGWRLLQNRLANPPQTHVTRPPAPQQPPVAPPAPANAPAAQGRKRTIRIRSAWTVRDAQGHWQQGTSDQVIELDE